VDVAGCGLAVAAPALLRVPVSAAVAGVGSVAVAGLFPDAGAEVPDLLQGVEVLRRERLWVGVADLFEEVADRL
jgi:hypothetical protein